MELHRTLDDALAGGGQPGRELDATRAAEAARLLAPLAREGALAQGAGGELLVADLVMGQG